MEYIIHQLDHKGSAQALADGQKVGEMTFSLAGDTRIIIDHTEIDPSHSGKGIGKQLLYKIVEKARAEKKIILPLCPFANAMFKKITEIQDVLH